MLELFLPIYFTCAAVSLVTLFVELLICFVAGAPLVNKPISNTLALALSITPILNIYMCLVSLLTVKHLLSKAF